MTNLVKNLFDEAVRLTASKNFQEAAEKYKTIVRQNPTHFESWLNLGAIYLAEEKPEKAIICFQSCLKIRKDHRIYYNIGLIHYKARRFAQATEYFLSSVTLKPDFLNGYLLAGYTFSEEKKYYQAIDVLEKGRFQCGEHESLMLCLAIAHYFMKNHKESLVILDRILTTNPANQTARRLKVRNISQDKLTESSLNHLKVTISTDPLMSDIDRIMGSEKNTQVIQKIAMKKRDLVIKKEKTREDYLNLSLLSFLMGNGNAAIDYLSPLIRPKV